MGAQTLALFFRALRVDVRLLHSHVMRLALLVFVLIVLFWAQAVSFAMGAPGLIFFTLITVINLVFASLAAPLLFATCITEEKEDQTLGLLRMANVRPITILAGKLAPLLASALLILVVQFPFTLLAITLGGVTWLQVWVVFWGLLAHTFLVANIGIFCSVVCRRTGNAVGLSVILVLLHFVVPAVGYAIVSLPVPAGAATSTEPKVQWFLWAREYGQMIFEPWYNATAWSMIWNVLMTGFGGSAWNPQVISNVIGGVAFFLLGWGVFDWFNRDVDVAATGARRSLVDVVRRKGRRSIRAWGNAALIGREFRFAAGGYSSWVIKLLVYGPAVYLLMVLTEGSWRRVYADDLGGMLMGMMLYLAIPLEAVVLASRVFRREIKERTWSSLAMLPRSVAGISYAKVAGAALALAPALFYFVVGSVLYPDGIIDVLEHFDEPETLVGLFVAVSSMLFLVHLVCWFSILTNSWIGILLAIVTWIATMILFQLCIMVPLMMGAMRGGQSAEILMEVLYGVMGCCLALAAALLHWHIGVRMRFAAAA